MRALLIAAAALIVPAFAGVDTASAGDWRDAILGPSAFREPLTSAASEGRARRQTRAMQDDDDERPARRIARSSDDDEAPQRRGRRQQPRLESATGGESGVASYYWQPQRVASGGWFNPNAMTAAHKTLPFGTRVRVTRVDTGHSVEVTINDRGPYVGGRVIDLSRAAASSIGMTGQGLARVRLSIIGR